MAAKRKSYPLAENRALIEEALGGEEESKFLLCSVEVFGQNEYWSVTLESRGTAECDVNLQRI
jgi:hypothetical protein